MQETPSPALQQHTFEITLCGEGSIEGTIVVQAKSIEEAISAAKAIAKTSPDTFRATSIPDDLTTAPHQHAIRILTPRKETTP
jgi:hypothetical protein